MLFLLAATMMTAMMTATLVMLHNESAKAQENQANNNR